jgi:heptosyltransferase-3
LKKRVLIYRLGSLGDTVVALPAWHVVCKAFPGATFTLLTNKPVSSKAAPVETVIGAGVFADVIDYPIGTRNPFRLATVSREIRRRRFDAVVNLCEARTRLKTIRDEVFFRYSGIRTLIGFPRGQSDFAPACDPKTGLYESETRRLLGRIRSLGTADLEDLASWDMGLTQEERAVAAAASPEGCTPLLALGVGTKMQAKDWGEENWVGLVKQLAASLPGWRLAIVGSADERQRAELCCSLWPGPRKNLCGSLSPRESAALLANAELFIGHDSGPMHLASAVGTRCVAIFAARNLPGQWFPARSGHKIIYHKTECFGCGLEKCTEEKKRCLTSITVTEVLDAGIQIIRAKNLAFSPR